MIHSLLAEKLTEINKKNYPAMLKKVREKTWICPFNRIHTRSKWGLFWTETHPSSKFCENPFRSFSIILPTN